MGDSLDKTTGPIVRQEAQHRLGLMSHYLFQSCNFRGREEYRPFYDLIANIAAEEWGHVELVAHTINLLLTGATTRGGDPSAAPLADAVSARARRQADWLRTRIDHAAPQALTVPS